MSSVVMVDVDDTLAATQRAMQAFLRQEYDTHYQFHQLTEDFREATDWRYRQKINAFLASPELVGNIQPFERSLSAVTKLSQGGWRVHIVSSRKENLHNVTRDWLDQHGFTPWIEDYHRRPDHLQGNRFKVRAAKHLNAQSAIDDTLSTALTLVDHGLEVTLIQRPWNKAWPKIGGLTRHRNVSAAVDYLLST